VADLRGSGGGHTPVASPRQLFVVCCMIILITVMEVIKDTFLICCSVSVYFFITIWYTSTSYICFVIVLRRAGEKYCITSLLA